MKSKKSLRQDIKALLLAQSVGERDQKSRVISKKLLEHPDFRKAGIVCFYVSMPMEVDTHPLIEASLKMGKKVLVPLVDLENKELKLKEIRDLNKDLAPGTLGILEPAASTKTVDARDVECILVPGLAFDKRGHRLGRGGGFYDRLLSQMSSRVKKIALTFSFQVLPDIPLEDHDQTVDEVLTEQ